MKNTHKIPAGAIVTISGHVMLKKVDAGTYRIEHGSPFSGRATYQLFKPRGKRPMARHFAADVERMLRPVGHGDLNNIGVTGPE